MIKKLLWLGIIFFGLYYFGNFTVNNTNVREYLHSKVTPEMMQKGRMLIVHLYDSARELYRSYEKDGKIVLIDEEAEPSTEVSKSNEQLQAVELINKLPLREISVQDKQKLIKILQSDTATDRAHP